MDVALTGREQSRLLPELSMCGQPRLLAGRILRSDRQKCGGAARSRTSGKYLKREDAKYGGRGMSMPPIAAKTSEVWGQT
jgi:hypothetical protein